VDALCLMDGSCILIVLMIAKEDRKYDATETHNSFQMYPKKAESKLLLDGHYPVSQNHCSFL
jgi:hypothetical protein